MRTDLQELRDAIRFGYATDHDLSTAKREDVIAIKRDPELVQYRFVAHKYSGDDTEDEEVMRPELSVEERSVTWRASDETADSYGDIVRVKGWNLDRYSRNGQILYAHDRNGLPLAKGTAWREESADDRALMVRGDFFDEGVNEFADGVLRIIKAGGLPGASVGFRAGEVNDPTSQKEREALGLGQYGLEFTDGHELLENSVVPIPANPNALQKRCLKALDGELESWLRQGEATPTFVQEFRKRFLEDFAETRRRALVTVPELPASDEPEKAAEAVTGAPGGSEGEDTPEERCDPMEGAPVDAAMAYALDELRADKTRLSRTTDYLLEQVRSLQGELVAAKTENTRLHEVVAGLESDLEKSVAGDAQQPEETQRGDHAVESSDRTASADEILDAFRSYLNASN